MVGGLAASSAMLSPVVQTVLQMGFEAALVESLVRTRFLLTGQHYTSVSNLVSDVLQAEQEDQRGSRSAGNVLQTLQFIHVFVYDPGSVMTRRLRLFDLFTPPPCFSYDLCGHLLFRYISAKTTMSSVLNKYFSYFLLR